MKSQDVTKHSVITFNQTVSNALSAGTKWFVTLVAAQEGIKGNMLMVKLGKKGQPLSYYNTPSNLQSLTDNEFSQLFNAGIITVEIA